MLRDRGIAVAGGIRTGVAPLAPYVLWRHRSPKLREIVHQMMLESNNHFAEQLLRALGATRGAGTEANGALVERAILTRDGVPQDGLRIVDGSGLAPSDRVTRADARDAARARRGGARRAAVRRRAARASGSKGRSGTATSSTRAAVRARRAATSRTSTR